MWLRVGGNGLEQTHPSLPSTNFSLHSWIHPEGGQPNPAPILSVVDGCSEDESLKSWELGIETKDGGGEQSAHVYFYIKSEMKREGNKLWGQDKYLPREWIHVGVTYDGTATKLYLNGARTALSTQQVGPLFSSLRTRCKQLVLGGEAGKEGGFRGIVADVRIWDRTLTQTEIIQLLHNRNPTQTPPHLNANLQLHPTLQDWNSFGGVSGVGVAASPGQEGVEGETSVPPCGQTLCDHPHILHSYVSHWELQRHKVVRYRVVNILDSHGSNPAITQQQIQLQHAALNEAFQPYNISWQLETHEVANSNLRRKTIIFGCDSSKVGNGQCNLECRHPITGNDGGDCDEVAACEHPLLHNGHCDKPCNNARHNWDNGECCNTSIPTHDCIDPTSPNRPYIGIEEYKEELNLTNERALTVTFADWSNTDLIGLATFPWEKDVHFLYGGIVLQPERYGTEGHKDNLIHEIGHALGLWHVHHGTSEMPCDDPCRELHPSALTGDLVEDTNPTPKNMECREPDGNGWFAGSAGKCRQDKLYPNTPYNNYMSYADEGCTNHFTPQQTARMHCYLDLKYKGWVEGREEEESVIPLPPTLASLAHSPPSLTLAWKYPLGHETCKPKGSVLGQSECTEDGRITQYAARASSRGTPKLSGYWAPHQATGPPDADACEASTKAWLPDVGSCGSSPEECVLVLEAEVVVGVEAVWVWVAWNAGEGVAEIRLLFSDNSSFVQKNIHAYCDMPYTFSLPHPKPLSRMEIHTKSPFVSIDAVQLISPPNESVCGECVRPLYRLHRTPPFTSGPFIQTTQREYTDGLDDVFRILHNQSTRHMCRL